MHVFYSTREAFWQQVYITIYIIIIYMVLQDPGNESGSKRVRFDKETEEAATLESGVPSHKHSPHKHKSHHHKHKSHHHKHKSHKTHDKTPDKAHKTPDKSNTKPHDKSNGSGASNGSSGTAKKLTSEEKRAVADIVVKYLTPYYKEGRIASRVIVT